MSDVVNLVAWRVQHLIANELRKDGVANYPSVAANIIEKLKIRGIVFKYKDQ